VERRDIQMLADAFEPFVHFDQILAHLADLIQGHLAVFDGPPNYPGQDQPGNAGADPCRLASWMMDPRCRYESQFYFLTMISLLVLSTIVTNSSCSLAGTP
jgi:hypothetical protein